MTNYTQVANVVPRVRYSANGVQTAFGFCFPVFDAEDLEVWVDQTLQPRAAYSVSGVGVEIGGTVIFTVPPPASTQVTLRRRMALKRDREFTDTAVESWRLNNALYYQMAALQQVADEASLAVKRSFRSLSNADLTLPEPAAGRSIRWNDAGDGLVNSAADVDSVLPLATSRAQDAAASAASQSSAASSAASATTSRNICDADVVVTGADRAAVAADKTSVAADRTTVHADRLAAEASAALALSAESAAALSAANAATAAATVSTQAATAQAAASAASASQSSAHASELSAAGSASAAIAAASQAQAAAGIVMFSNVAVSGQATVAADQAGDTLTLVAGSALSITTDAASDSVTIAVTQSGIDSLIGLSTAGRALIDDADASAQRTTLGLGNAATLSTGHASANLPTVAAMHAMAAAFTA
ncbi:hypothetical protein [Paramagnetospirillum magneticum]|uniref:Cell wall-associated hydrolase n=1 Tax=Paramagnetospirillum magneticum (strain ATCC 700264 / AMB-1) TaxID=342108 RepID=Q2VZA0_PARM1|nr:hypothetical protein [Paramagnetospirillum magneticum]BAE53075.1 Cell wall-associated hydrolase [Paramagnetospirillum magneticum AMB-1]